jgi:hypothetical protein
MSKWSWKAGAVVVAIGAGTAYAVAQMGPGMHGPMEDTNEMMQRHHQMMQGHQGMHGPMMDDHAMQGQHGMHGGMMGQAQQPTMPGQAAFGAIQEVVQILEADPTTDWSKVNIAPLRQHLIDMDEVTLRAAADERSLDDGVEITVTGEGRTLEAIKRMIPAHAHELKQIGWNAMTEDLSNGVKFTVTTADPKQVAKLKALGFMGIMALGPHHQPHHLMMAKGEFKMH